MEEPSKSSLKSQTDPISDISSIPTRLKKWSRKFVEDLKNPKLLPLKALMFIVFGANWSLLPFLSLQARALGISGEEVGIIYSFLAFPALIAPPCIGMLADKVGNFKILLSVTTVISALCSILFICVPIGRITRTYPDEISGGMTCSPFNSSFYMDDIHGCQHENGVQFNVSYTNCYVSCKSSLDDGITSGDPLICDTPYNCFLNASQSLFGPRSNLTIAKRATEPSWLAGNLNATFSVEASNSTNKYKALSPFCPRPVSVKLKPPGNQEHCATKCEVVISRKEACLETTYVQELDPEMTFYLHLLIRVFFECTLATSMPLTEGALITVVKNYGGDFGLQRMYANLGMMIMTPITGLLVENPWAAMPFEAMEAVTTSLILVTFMGYSAELSTVTTIVTLQGIYQGLYHGVGRATGSMIGGYLIEVFGTFLTFRILAMASGLVGLLYFVSNYIYLTVTAPDERIQKPKKEKLENVSVKMPEKWESSHDNKGFEQS